MTIQGEGGRRRAESSRWCVLLALRLPLPTLRLPGPALVRDSVVPVLGNRSGLVSVSLLRPHELPTSGPVLLVANHQSHLDPVLVGIACPRQLKYLCASRFVLLAVQLVDSRSVPFPSTVSAARWAASRRRSNCSKRTRPCSSSPKVAAHMTDSFSRCGQASVCWRGAAVRPLCLSRCKVPSPRCRRGSTFPRPGSITLAFAPPITSADYELLTDAQLVQLVESRIVRNLAGSRHS